jgi:hypothetical protein
MNYIFHLKSTNGEYIGYASCFYSLAVALVILPGFMIYVMSRPLDVIQSENFELTYGSLYEGVKKRNKWQVGANIVFMARRFLFVIICFNFDKHSSIQIILVNLINLACSIYYG